MSAFSNYLENEILDWVNGGSSPTQLAATWVQLFNDSTTANQSQIINSGVVILTNTKPALKFVDFEVIMSNINSLE
jgi:hypothetical protein